MKLCAIRWKFRRVTWEGFSREQGHLAQGEGSAGPQDAGTSGGLLSAGASFQFRLKTQMNHGGNNWPRNFQRSGPGNL